MPRTRKDGKHLNIFIQSDIYDELDRYSKEKGQTKTIAVERILKSFFDSQSIEKILNENPT